MGSEHTSDEVLVGLIHLVCTEISGQLESAHDSAYNLQLYDALKEKPNP